MNNSSLYFRTMDIFSISFIILMGVVLAEPWFYGNSTSSELLTFIAFAILILWLILSVVFQKTKKDDFANACSQKAYLVTGKFMLMWLPFLYVIAAFVQGMIDGFTGESRAILEIFSNLSTENIVVTLWLIALTSYLAAFNWFRFRGTAL